MEKILTVSIAAYNVEEYIEETLKSLIVPEIMNEIEVIIVDDGGKDRTIEIARKYSERYPNTFVIVQKENGGYGSVINTSIKKARGKYFKQLDGDDCFCTENLASFLDLLKNNDVDIILTEVIKKFDGTDKYEVSNRYENIIEKKYRFSSYNFKSLLTMHSSTIKTEILKKMKYELTEHCFYTDVELVSLPMKQIETFYVWHEPIYVYRVGREGQSVSITGIRKHYRDHEMVFWRILKDVYREMPDDNKKTIINHRLRKEAVTQIMYCCVLESKKDSYRELKNYVAKLRSNAPDILLDAESDRRSVRLLIKTRLLIFPLVRARFLKSFS